MNRSKHVSLRTVFTLLALLLVVWNYQACIPATFDTKSKISESLAPHGNGNGDSYPGKLDYYNSSESNNPCNRLSLQGRPFPKQQIFSDGLTYSLVRDNCQDITPILLDPSLITLDSSNRTFTYNGVRFTPQADLSEFNQVPIVCPTGKTVETASGNLFASPLDLASPVWNKHPEIKGVLDGSIEALPNFRIEVTDPTKLENWRRVAQDPLLTANTPYVLTFLLKRGTTDFASIAYNEMPAGQFSVVVDLVNATGWVEWQTGSTVPTITSIQRYGTGVAVSVAFTSAASTSGRMGDPGVAPFRPNNNGLYAVGDSVYATSASFNICR